MNPVEGAVNIFKQAVTSVLLSACTEEGPLTIANVLWAAEHACHVHERWCKERHFDTYRGGYTEMRLPWQLSTLRCRGEARPHPAMGHAGGRQGRRGRHH